VSRFDRNEVAMIIGLIMATIGLATILFITAFKFSIFSEPEKDWCRDRFGHDQPMEFCDYE
jgi:hypothetical protein